MSTTLHSTSTLPLLQRPWKIRLTRCEPLKLIGKIPKKCRSWIVFLNPTSSRLGTWSLTLEKLQKKLNSRIKNQPIQLWWLPSPKYIILLLDHPISAEKRAIFDTQKTRFKTTFFSSGHRKLGRGWMIPLIYFFRQQPLAKSSKMKPDIERPLMQITHSLNSLFDCSLEKADQEGKLALQHWFTSQMTLQSSFKSTVRASKHPFQPNENFCPSRHSQKKIYANKLVVV